MSQFTCEICGSGFDQQSRYQRHMQTAHPKRAPSAADLEKALAGIDFPASLEQMLGHADKRADAPLRERLHRLPEREYRDAAEVARALGEVIGHTDKPQHQPSQVGGEHALASGSAAHVARAMQGIKFPTDAQHLREHVQRQDDQAALAVVEQFSDRTYRDMADVAKEIGRVT